MQDMQLLGQRHFTARRSGTGSLGYRGEAIWALAGACTSLVITSRASGSLESFTTVLQPGQPSKLGPSASGQRLPSCGTSTTLAGFMQNQPVRLRAMQRCASRRTMHISASAACTHTLLKPVLFVPRSNEAATLKEALWAIFVLALPYSSVSVEVRDVSGNMLLDLAQVGDSSGRESACEAL